MTHAEDLIAPDAKLEKLAGGMKFTEGPVWSNEDGGFLIFSDIPANELKKWTEKDGVKTFRNPSNNTNGNTRDKQGRLISCEHSARRVTITEADGSVKVLADKFEGKRFNSPNDVVVKSDGTLFFTDPIYGLGKQPKEMPGNYVYALDPITNKITVLATDFDNPNGLCLSPDEKILYVADSGKPKHVRAFDVTKSPEGYKLENARVFAQINPGVPDGMRCDEQGNLWSSAGDGVHIFSPAGTLITKIPVPETPANLCFGGADKKTLFITAKNSLYRIAVNVAGARY